VYDYAANRSNNPFLNPNLELTKKHVPAFVLGKDK